MYTQDGVRDKFRFSSFCFQYVVYLLQLILSVIPEPRHAAAFQLLSADQEVYMHVLKPGLIMWFAPQELA